MSQQQAWFTIFLKRVTIFYLLQSFLDQFNLVKLVTESPHNVQADVSQGVTVMNPSFTVSISESFIKFGISRGSHFQRINIYSMGG